MLQLFSHPKLSRVLSGTLFIVLVFNNLIFPTRAFGLTSGAAQPEFSSFDSAAASEMVNLFTGDFSYNIPIMDVDGYPVNISYHAQPGMDQEASWVGLGWNINSGAVSRNMRGLPDDFSGDEIRREINIRDFKSWGVGIGGGVEISGLSKIAGLNISAGMGVTSSNYKGVGIEFYFEPTLSLAAGNKMAGSLTAGLGMKASTTDGVSIYPQLGVSGQYRSMTNTASIGYNIGASYNSREGLTALNHRATASASFGKFQKGPNTFHKNRNLRGFYSGKGVGMGLGVSISVPVSSQGFLPQIANSMRSQSYSLDFKLGVNACVIAPYGYIRGYYAQNGMASSDIHLGGFGYLYSQHGDRKALHDFSRSRDGMMYEETPNLPMTNYSYDLFSASAQGLEFAFRPYRNDIGMLHDNETTESSFGIGLGGEVLAAPDVNLGINENTIWSDGVSGRWDQDNAMRDIAAFSNTNGSYEASYFKAAGEKTPDDAAFISAVRGDQAAAVKLEKLSSGNWKATNILREKSGQGSVLGGNSYAKTKRAVRQNLVSWLNASEAQYGALEKDIRSYTALLPGTDPASQLKSQTDAGEFKTTSFQNYNRLTMSLNRSNHISELTVTNTSGGRYVYGLPVYNRDQQEVTFNISGSGQTHANSPNGLIDYSSTDASKSNSKGQDNFYEKNMVPGYASSYLLTGMLSADYVDRTGDGPSPDDFGDYTKFNYTLMGSYNWRFPYQENKSTFNQGFLSDKTDDKGSYVYGSRDQWLPHSIETKNYIAFFILDNSRKDARETQGESGGRAASPRNQYFLKEIRLYAKKDFGSNPLRNALNQMNVTPLKVVHFEYDYSLCPGVPNNINTVTPGVSVPEASGPSQGLPSNGKLTLKKIWFTNGSSGKASLTPFRFNYCNGNYNNPADNPVYDPASVDRWGAYQPNTGGNKNSMDFPYTRQNRSQADVNTRAWNLTEIRTPTGSRINVTYEADDYAFVQDVGASQMFPILGMAQSPSAVPGQQLVGNGYLFVDLSSGEGDGVATDAVNPAQELRRRYFADMEKIYLKTCVDLGSGQYEFVPLYADIEDIQVNNTSTYSYGGNTYFNAIVKLKSVGINDDDSDRKINPIKKAAFQLGRMYLPGVVFPGSQPNGQDDEQIIKGMVTMFQDLNSLFSGINKALDNRKVADQFDPARSVARLRNPSGKKIGGGARVKKIEVDDGWNAMSGEASSVYGQEYTYTTDQNGRTISSGVASYEPMNGNDENALRQPVEFSVKRVMAPNDAYFQEQPLGEQFYPDAVVGYSKVSVRNLDHSAQNVTKHATGHTEHEFYTAKDFPVIAEATDLQKQPVKPDLFRELLDFGRVSKLYMSQGFVIRTNDMHGRPRSQKSYAEGATEPYTGVIYHYKTKSSKPNELDNSVSVIGKDNVVSTKVIGVTTDIVTDSRSSVSTTWGAGASANVNVASCTLYVPLVFIWPSLTKEQREFYSITTTKVVHQYGLIDHMEAFENNSKVETHNMLYDEETGDVLLTRTLNNYDDPVFNFAYPAYWAYEGMGPAYLNAGIRTTGLGALLNTTSGALSGTFLMPGDEVLVSSFSLGNVKAWVILDETNGNQNYLVRENGSKLTTNENPVVVSIKFLRSGRRNHLASFMSSLSSLQNPIAGNKINVTASTKVLSTAATEFSEKRQLAFGRYYTPPVCLSTYYEASFNTFCNMIKSMFNPNLQSAYGSQVSLFTSDQSVYYPITAPNQNPSYVSMWKNPIFPKIPNTSSDHIVTGFTYQYNSSPQYAASIFKEFIDMQVTYPVQCAFVPGSAIYMVVDRSKLQNGMDELKFMMFPHTTASNFVPANTNFPPTHPCTNNSYQNFLTISLIMPSNSTTTFRWQDVSGVDDFAPQNDCVGQFYRIKFKCYDAQGNFLSDAFMSYSNPDFAVTHQYNSGPIQCGKKLSDVVNPYVENLRGSWYPKNEYAYLTDRSSGNGVRNDGWLSGFKPFYDQKNSSAWLPVHSSSRTWDYNAGLPFDKWTKSSEAELLDQYGNPLQSRDALQRPSAVVYGYNHTLPVAVAANSSFNHIAFDGFEDYAYSGSDCSAMTASNPSGFVSHGSFLPQSNSYQFPRSNYAHSGRYSLTLSQGSSVGANKVSMTRELQAPGASPVADNVPYTLKAKDNTGLFGPYHSFGTAQKFVTSVWVREVEPWQTAVQSLGQTILTSAVKNDYGSNASIYVSLSNSPSTPLITVPVKKTGIINGWQKLEYEFTVPANQPAGSITIELRNASLNRSYLFDDFRVQPYQASMKTMVYDPFTLRLMAEQDERNFSTFYEYDNEGVEVRRNKETENGIYTLTETRKGLKK